ncbi:MAG: hypothetical protein ACYDBJ_18380, partial [Aggregatilineales bacterium]
MIEKHKFIIYMKAGPYCGFDLSEIVEIKKREQQSCGQFYWGYGGVFCHPKRVRPFVDLALSQGIRPKLMFSITNSSFSSEIGRVFEFSVDGTAWQSLPNDVLLVGNKYAIVAKNLTPVNFNLELSAYSSMLGDKRMKPLNEYIKYRVDKACAVYTPHAESSPKLVPISF